MIQVRNNQLGRKTIDIDLNESVTISLRNEQYDELMSALEVSNDEKIKFSDKRVENAINRTNNNIAFINDIRDVFYENYGSVHLKKSLKEIDVEKLDAILEKYSALLGFE